MEKDAGEMGKEEIQLTATNLKQITRNTKRINYTLQFMYSNLVLPMLQRGIHTLPKGFFPGGTSIFGIVTNKQENMGRNGDVPTRPLGNRTSRH